MSVHIRPLYSEAKQGGLTLAEPVLVTLTTPERLLAAVRRRWHILAVCLALGVAGGIGAGLALPKWYESTVSFAVLPIDDPTAPIPTDPNLTALPLFSQIISSRRVADEVISRLGLDKAWGKTPQDSRTALLKHTTVWFDRKSNVVTLTVEDRVASRARMIAEAFGEVARNVNNEIWSAKSTESRKRLEARLEEVSKQLAAAEAEMRAFREREHVSDLPEQIKASVGEASFLERMKNERKMSLHFNQGFAGADAPEVKRSQLEAGSAQAALQGLVHGGSQRGPLLALDSVPRLEQEHARLKRQIDTYNALYEVLVRQVEQLRAAESRPGGRAELLDAPVEALKAARPSKVALSIEGLLVGLIFGLALVVWPRTPFTDFHRVPGPAPR